jgi:hypothetical protein
MADAGPELVGVHDAEATTPYVPREADDRLENVLGTDRPLVVITGDRLAGTSRAVHRGLRRMLGDTRLLVIAEPHIVDLAHALSVAAETAARTGPVVVLADDAPPALLDQVVPALLGRLSADVRLVLTTRRSFLDTHLAAPTRALLGGALLATADAGTPMGERVRPVLRARSILDPVGWSSLLPLGLLRTAVDWERVGVATPLTPRLLAEVAPVHLAALGVPAPETEELRRVTRDLVRADHGGMRLLRATRRAGRVHLAADRLFSHLADSDASGWAVPEELARDLWGRLGPDERARTARVALARGDDQVALWLATQVSPDDLEPEALYRLGVTLAERSAAHAPEPGRWDRGALNWLTAALDRADRDDTDLVHRAHRSILMIEARRNGTVEVPQAREPQEAPQESQAPRDRLIYLREVARA